MALLVFELMKIILVRHGRPEIDLAALSNRWVTANEFGQVVSAYQTSDLAGDEQPPAELVQTAASCHVFLSSTLQRSVSSCAALGVEKVSLADAIFDEASMPFANWKFVRLPIGTWSVLFRIGWMFGFHQNADRVRAIGDRAKLAAQALVDQADENGDVMLIGHGIINRMIANHLANNHWRMMSSNGDDYWSFTVYEDHLSTQDEAPLRL